MQRSSCLKLSLISAARPEARYLDSEAELSDQEVTSGRYRLCGGPHVGEFNEDNRAGIERTLHRISAIKNRQDRVVGITCRDWSRYIRHDASIIEDLVAAGGTYSSCYLASRASARPRCCARWPACSADDFHRRRVLIVDTSNEIAGDGDIPHPALGHARRMQVPQPHLQHHVMIEAVENHMPEVIIIDEIGTEAEAAAARTIAERGVQLIGTAHGNPAGQPCPEPDAFRPHVGGIQAVTLGRRGGPAADVARKTVLERKAPPTFQCRGRDPKPDRGCRPRGH